jgi:hypothetical protein
LAGCYIHTVLRFCCRPFLLPLDGQQLPDNNCIVSAGLLNENNRKQRGVRPCARFAPPASTGTGVAYFRQLVHHPSKLVTICHRMCRGFRTIELSRRRPLFGYVSDPIGELLPNRRPEMGIFQRKEVGVTFRPHNRYRRSSLLTTLVPNLRFMIESCLGRDKLECTAQEVSEVVSHEGFAR